MNDFTLLIYILGFAVSLWGGILFTIELIRKRGARPIFIYVLALLYGVAIQYGMALFMRVQFIMKGDDPKEFVMGLIWPSRCIVLVLAVCAIVGHMTWRFFKGGHRE